MSSVGTCRRLDAVGEADGEAIALIELSSMREIVAGPYTRAHSFTVCLPLKKVQHLYRNARNKLRGLHTLDLFLGVSHTAACVEEVFDL